jgi:hypothetical protein
MMKPETASEIHPFQDFSRTAMGYPIPSHDFPFSHHENSQKWGKPVASNASARPQDAAQTQKLVFNVNA